MSVVFWDSDDPSPLDHLYVLQSGQMVAPFPYCSHCSIRAENVLGPCLFLKITVFISDMEKLSLLYPIFHRIIICQSVTVHSSFPSKETVLFLVSSLLVFQLPPDSLSGCICWGWSEEFIDIWKVFVFLPPPFRWNIVHDLNKISRRKQSQV